MTLEERKRRGAQLIEQMLGTKDADEVRRSWRKICPEFEQYVTGFVAGEIWARHGLDRRTKSLITIAALTAMGRPRALELNIRMALNNGATRSEVVETLLHLAPYAGFPAAWESLATAWKIFREVDAARSPRRPPKVRQRRERP